MIVHAIMPMTSSWKLSDTILDKHEAITLTALQLIIQSSAFCNHSDRTLGRCNKRTATQMIDMAPRITVARRSDGLCPDIGRPHAVAVPLILPVEQEPISPQTESVPGLSWAGPTERLRNVAGLHRAPVKNGRTPRDGA